MGEPGTPPSGSKRGRQIVVIDVDDLAESSPLAVPTSAHGSRNVRLRSDCVSPSQDGLSTPPLPAFAEVYKFLVYLPNTTSVEVKVDGAICKNLTVPDFVELVRIEHSKTIDANAKQKQREINWKNKVYITDFQGNPVAHRKGVFTFLEGEFMAGRGLLLYDNHPDTVHSHSDFWNVTPETHLLQILPQDYSVFSALADELDNSLQAVYQVPSENRLICVDLDHANGKISIFDTGKGMDSTSQNSISKWGTMGSSMYRRLVSEAIGIPPPYLKPNFGMFGLGGVGAGLHLGGCISVSSKTRTSQRVAVLHLAKETLTTNIKSGSVWKTGGEFRPPTEEELQWSPHGSFTKVEIWNLNREITTWNVEEVQRKLKDFYFPYIQNDAGAGGITSRPVEILVNGDDLAGVVGGETSHTNYYSGVGEPFVLLLEFTKSTPGGGLDKANARITCHYFPVNKGREAIDNILEQLKEEDSKFTEPGVFGEVNFHNYSRRCIRRLGRLLPGARGGRLPFMEPKKAHRENEVNRHCFKRAKAFIDVDAGFVPTHSKTDLDPNHVFTEALLKLGSGLQIGDSARGLVTVTITRNGAPVKPEQLHTHYKQWITHNHEKYDVGAVIDESSAVIVASPNNKEELNLTDEVFRVVYDIKCGDYNWKVGKKEAPKRLKLLKGIQGLNNNDTVLYATVECFISEGLADEPGETRIICRPMEVPEERGSKEIVDGQNQEHFFHLGESRAFPIEILFGGKCDEVDEAVWRKQLEKSQGKSPGFVEILNDQESLPRHANLQAGAVLPAEIIAAVRPKIWKVHMTLKGSDSKRLQQKYIIAEPMEMTLVVGKISYQPPEVKFPKIVMANVEKEYEIKVTASTRNNLKGLYCFNMTGNKLESINRTTGTYFLFFSLVSGKYQDVDECILRINIAPSSKIGKWSICSHPGPCNENHENRSPEVMRVRLGGLLPGSLYLTRFDEFGNQMGFEGIPPDVKCGLYTTEGDLVKISSNVSKDHLVLVDEQHHNLEIPKIRLGYGNLEPLKPTTQARLGMIVAGERVGSFVISVFPGGVATARMKESEALDNGFRPGHILERIVFEVLDNHQNPVSAGEKVKVVLEGFKFQDKVGHIRSVDGNGCLDLGMRLQVTAGYGEEACLGLRSVEPDSSLWKKTFKVITRNLRTKNAPDHVLCGSRLTGIEIEAVDENGQVDQTMDGTAHNLTLGWVPGISVPLHNGRCSLPPIQMLKPGMWEGFVAHSQYPTLKTNISVRVGKSEREGDDYMPSEDPYDISPSPGSAVRSDQFESKALALRSAPHDEDPNLALRLALETTMEKSKLLEGKLLRLGRKLKKQEDELERLEQMKTDYDQSMKQCQVELDMLKVVSPENLKTSGSKQVLEVYNPTTVDNQVEPCNPSTNDTPGNINILECSTPVQVEMQIAKLGHPPGTNAAAILLQAQRQQDCGTMRDVIGIVALLGAVEKEEINRALVEFLGLENMLAIICASTSAAECFGILNADGTLDPNEGLYGFAKSHNLPITGRFRVITLSDESSFYKRLDGWPAVDPTGPQQLLHMGPIAMPQGSERPVGSLGYAVNLIHLNEEQLRIRIAGCYGLRDSLFFVLFGFLEVFDTTINMLRARKEIRSSAISLDGGLIRTSNQFEWGLREDPVVWFPTWVPADQLGYNSFGKQIKFQGMVPAPPPPPPLRRFIPFKEARPAQHKQRKEVMKAMDAARRSYIDRGVEENIHKLNQQLISTKAKIDAVTETMKALVEKGNAMTALVLPRISK